MTKWSLSQECKIQLMFRSISVTDCIQCNIISTNMERHLSNYKCPFLSLKKKILSKLETDGDFHTLRKNIFKKLTVNIIWTNVLTTSCY